MHDDHDQISHDESIQSKSNVMNHHEFKNICKNCKLKQLKSSRLIEKCDVISVMQSGQNGRSTDVSQFVNLINLSSVNLPR